MSDAPILDGIHHITELDAAGDFEKKHTPFIETQEVDGRVRVTVRVGHWVSHPNQTDHWIEWVELQVNGAPIVRVGLAAGVAYPDLSVVLALDSGTTLRAVESCNIHGLWAAEVTV